MIKDILRRFLSLTLSAILLLSLLPVLSAPALAATNGVLSGLSNPDIGASWTGTDDGGYVNWGVTGGNSFTGSVRSKGSSCGNAAYSTTLTLTNNKSMAATLSFDYTVALNSGTIQVGGSEVTENGNYSNILQPGDSIEITLSSNKSNTTTATTITVINLFLIADVKATVTFRPAENGSYTVNGEQVATEISKTEHASTPYTLSATPAAGYKFMCWYSESTGKTLSRERQVTLYFDSNQTITAQFVPEANATFETLGNLFDDLNAACTYAEENQSDKITVVSSGILPAGDYTIPAGITLLVPFDEAGTCYTEEPGIVAQTYTKPNEFRKLTLSSGANIMVKGAVSVSAKISAPPGSADPKAATTGNYGRIEMLDGSSMTVDAGGNLYVYGYVTGNGTITANSGAQVHEVFELREFRGGNATTNIALLNKAKKVFPLTQYYIQNIEAPLVLLPEADLKAHTALYALSSTHAAQVTIVGTDGLFRLEDGSIAIRYLPDQDRSQIDIHGNATIASVSLSLGGSEITSSDFLMPINGQFDIKIHSGTTKIAEDTELLPGVTVRVDQGATLQAVEGKSIYAYDQTEWESGNFVFSNKKMAAAAYSPTRTYTRTAADLKDVVIDVNGSIIADGFLYTTAGGADVISSQGTGTITMNNGAGQNSTINQALQNPNVSFVEIPVTSAKLHNGERYAGTAYEYTETAGAAAGTTYSYCPECDKWYTGAHSHAAQIVNGAKADAYETLAEALTLYDAGTKSENAADDKGLPYIQLLADSTEPGFTIDKDVYLDLNGHTVTLTSELTISEGATLYGMDSATEGYSDARYGKIAGTVRGTGKVAVAHETYRLAGGKVRRYVSYQNENELSFHRYNMSVTNYEFHFRANGQCDMDFGATFRGSSTVVQLLKDMGFKVVESDTSKEGWQTIQNGGLPADLNSGYVLRGTLIDIGSNEPSEFTKYYDIYALLKFQDNTVVESVPRNLNYLWALKQYYKSSDATDDEKAVINAFLEKNNLWTAWNSIN